MSPQAEQLLAEVLALLQRWEARETGRGYLKPAVPDDYGSTPPVVSVHRDGVVLTWGRGAGSAYLIVWRDVMRVVQDLLAALEVKP